MRRQLILITATITKTTTITTTTTALATKTTALANNGFKIATIVNDMRSSEINVACTLINQGSFNQMDEELIELSMVVFVDLVDDIIKVQKHENEFDYILVETTDVSETSPAHTFELDVLDNITIVYCKNILNYTNFTQRSMGVKMNATKLIMEQILNNTDVLDNNTDELNVIKQLLTFLNPKSKDIATKYSKCDHDLKDMLNTGLYDVNKYRNKPDWNDEFERFKNDVRIPETE